ncbi:DUF5996 family protein [Christiangramia aquimixticola]|uniref:DUF5996 family protein n=1 Tax=Christiangramia aquimixticola TaxID=1697558 RepID=UPI003AA7B190
MKTGHVLPELKYVGNEKHKLTLHLFFQILGKIRMSFTPRKNHWWYITLYVYEKGFTTGPIPINKGFESFSVSLNILEHRVDIVKSTGDIRSFRLEKNLSVSDFYNYLTSILRELDINIRINAKPYEVGIEKHFSEIHDIHHYNKKYAAQYWKAFLWVNSIFNEFSGRFYGKTSPSQLFWHSMDLAVTRFSGKKVPTNSDSNIANKDSYSHECISFGFWAGDENTQEPAFYSYAFPSPEHLDKETLEPAEANWIMINGGPMAILTYADLARKDNPGKVLLEFMESAYQASAGLADWDIDAFKVPPLKEL